MVAGFLAAAHVAAEVLIDEAGDGGGVAGLHHVEQPLGQAPECIVGKGRGGGRPGRGSTGSRSTTGRGAA